MTPLNTLLSAIRTLVHERQVDIQQSRLEQVHRKWRIYGNSLAISTTLVVYALNPLLGLPVLMAVYPLLRVIGRELADKQVRSLDVKANPLGSIGTHELLDALNDELARTRITLEGLHLSDGEKERLLAQAAERWIEESTQVRAGFRRRLKSGE